MAKLADALLGLAQAAIVVERATASSTAFLTKIKVLIICATHCDFSPSEFCMTSIPDFEPRTKARIKRRGREKRVFVEGVLNDLNSWSKSDSVKEVPVVRHISDTSH